MQNFDFEKLGEYTKFFTNEDFWKKAKDNAVNVGKEGLRQALRLFYVLQKKNIPPWAKGVVLGALGYFISPIDIIPDFIPVTGYTDDVAVIAAALGIVTMYIDDDVKRKADQKLEEWFGGNL